MTGALAALDDDLDMIQQQLEHQMQAQDQNQDDSRSVMWLTGHALSSSWLKLAILLFFQVLLAAGRTVQTYCCGCSVPATSNTNSSHSHKVNQSTVAPGYNHRFGYRKMCVYIEVWLYAV